MLTQVLLSKRLFQEASQFAERQDAVSCGLSISLLQDAVEMFVWALVKVKGLPVKDLSPFTTNLDALQKNGITIPETPRLLELNKARVGFKHYGNLPAPTEAQKFRTYVEDFFRSATQTHFGKEFDQLSLVDLVPYLDVQARLRVAEEHIKQSHFQEAVRETSIAKKELFAKLDHHLPQVDRHLLGDFRTPEEFRYLGKYLSALREVVLVTLLHLPFKDYAFLNGTLFSAFQTMDGTWNTTDTAGVKYDEAVCRRQIACLVEISIRLQSIG